MPKFKVLMQQITTEVCEMEIEASSIEKAQEIAKATSGEYEYKWPESIYKIQGIKEATAE